MPRLAKVKVLQVIRPAAGGMKEHVKSLLRNLDSESYELAVAGPVEKDLAELADKHGITVFLLNIRGELAPFADLVAAVKLAMIISKLQPAIVHAHGSKAGLLARLACLLAHPKKLLFPISVQPAVLITLHNLVYTGSVVGFKQRLLKGVERLLDPVAGQFIAVSESLRLEVLEYQRMRADKVVTIYNGLDIEAFTNPEPKVRQKLGVGESTLLIGTVARLAPQKGVEYFIRMAEILALRHPDIAFVIVGDGPLRKQLEELKCGLPGKPRILFTGFVAPVKDYLAAMDIFVLPSLSEGLGISVLEALACKKPVVATQVGGIPEIIQSQVNGLLVPPKDEQALADGVDWLLEHREQAQQMAKTGYVSVETKFALKNMIRVTERVYQQILQVEPGGEFIWQPK